MAGPINQEYTQSILSALTNIKTGGNEEFKKKLNVDKSILTLELDESGNRKLKIWVPSLHAANNKTLSDQESKDLFKKFFDEVQKNNAAYQFSEAATQDKPRQKVHFFADDKQKQEFETRKSSKPAKPDKAPVNRTYVTLSAQDQTAISDTAKKFLQEISVDSTTKVAEQPKKEESKPTAAPSHTPTPQAKAPDAPKAPVSENVTSKTVDTTDVDKAALKGRENALKVADEDAARIKRDQDLTDQKRDKEKSDAIKQKEAEHQNARIEAAEEDTTPTKNPKADLEAAKEKPPA